MAKINVPDEKVFQEKYIWKRRFRNAPSAPASDKEIQVFILWKGRDLPTQEQRKDRLLWHIWTLKTDWTYKVVVVLNSAHRVEHQAYFDDEREALEEYRRLSKEFPRSKEVDYGFPFQNPG